MKMAIEIVDFPINSMVIFSVRYVKLPEGTSSNIFFVIRKSQTLVGMVDDWVDEIGFTKLPSGKRLHNYGKSPFLTVSQL